MRRSWADAARVAEVRDAARSWREAGAIDADTLRAIEVAYPDARHRPAADWRALIFLLVSVAVNAVFFGIALASGSNPTAFVLVFGLALTMGTEILRLYPSAGNGSDAATSLFAVVYVLAGGVLVWGELKHHSDERLIPILLGAAVVLFGAACFHWGYAAYGAFAAAALFLFLGQFRGGRVGWVVAGLALTAAAYRRLDRDYPPPLRRAVGAVFAVSAVALYAAVNRYSLDRGWIEDLRWGYSPSEPASGTLRLLCAAATALLPLVFLTWGIRSRRTLVLDLGLAFTAASLVTLRYYVHVAPLWALLSVGGAVLILGALWLNRFLRLAPGERRGFTADPLFTGQRRDQLQAAAVLAGFTPSAARPVEDGGLAPGGGRFGGGGASGEF